MYLFFYKPSAVKLSVGWRWSTDYCVLGVRETEIHDYFADVAEELSRWSGRIRRDFATHRPSAGGNREVFVGDFLRENLPQNFGVDTGLILSQSGEFSNQADLLIVDQTWNAPLYPTSPNRIWLVEAVYALIEVKTRLSPSDLSDALTKCKRFKNLPRSFQDVPALPQIADSLFVLWGFEAPSPQTAKQNIVKALAEIPRVEQPDFIVVPDSLLVTAGGYRQLAKVGQPGSSTWQMVSQETGGDIERAIGDPVEVLDMGKYALLLFLIWLGGWLKSAGQRSAPLQSYLRLDYEYGRII